MEMPAVFPPSTEIRDHARTVSPRTGANRIEVKPALGEEIFHPQLRPARTIDGHLVYLDQKWRGHQEVSAGFQHLVDIRSRSIRPQQMLEHLFCNDQVESFVESG